MACLLILAVATYLILTATLSYQLRNFSRFLKETLAAEISATYESGD
jgi:hypothetical protein